MTVQLEQWSLEGIVLRDGAGIAKIREDVDWRFVPPWISEEYGQGGSTEKIEKGNNSANDHTWGVYGKIGCKGSVLLEDSVTVNNMFEAFSRGTGKVVRDLGLAVTEIERRIL